MNRDDVKVVVLDFLRETVEALEDVEIDTAASMKNYGVNSLDIVEVVSCSMRTLRVKVPRATLGKLTNIDGLIDTLYAAVVAKEAR